MGMKEALTKAIIVLMWFQLELVSTSYSFSKNKLNNLDFTWNLQAQLFLLLC